ncbi:MAG: tetratricopeptide repeat protein [Bacteroidetes bacterium]|nr:tetratricopeptide repeat protein [Bacteroidota bacterium]
MLYWKSIGKFWYLSFVLSLISLSIRAQEEVSKLSENVISKSVFEQQQDRHIEINDSLFRKGNLKLQFNYLENLRIKAVEINSPRLIAVIDISYGNLYLETGNYYRALEAFQNAIKLFEAENSYSGVNSARANIGNTYYYMGNLEKALDYYKKAIEDYKKIKDIKPETEGKLANLYNNLGIIYASKKDYLYGKIYFDLALNLWHKQKDTISIAYIYNNYASVYMEQNKVDSAFYYFTKAKDLKLRHGNQSDMVDAYNNLCDFYQRTNNNAKALEMAKLAESFLNKSEFTADNRVTYTNLSNLYAKTGDVKNELKYIKLLNVVKDTLDKRSESDNISRLELKNDFDKIHLADSLKNQEEIRLKDLKISQKKNQSYFLILALVLTFLVLGLIYSRFKVTSKQKKIIEEQKEIVELKNKEITDSINYASRLQGAILPSETVFKEVFSECFILFKPKDIVSGDFYFFEKKGQDVFIAAADCTGHGVPGAMLSIACYNALQKAIFELNLNNTGSILDAVKDIVISNFNKSDNQIKDGMDISLLKIDLANKQIQWTGANNRLIYVQDKFLNELKPDRKPVGVSENSTPFTSHTIPYQKETVFYLFTDGLTDQFGGPNQKKLTIAKVRQLIEDVKSRPLNEQSNYFKSELAEWQGSHEQTDDITMVAIKI